MKKIVLVLILLNVAGASFSQEEKKQFIHKGLVRSMATIASGTMLKQNVSTISIHGTLEYYISDNISIRGDSYYFLQSKHNYGYVIPDPYFFEFNHSTFSGASYHFSTKNHFDYYLAIEPGIGITKRAGGVDCQAWLCEPSGSSSVNPLFSSAFGFNYYFQKLFHLFGEARYIAGKHLSEAQTPLSLNELRFSFGLGFNLSVFKPKN